MRNNSKRGYLYYHNRPSGQKGYVSPSASDKKKGARRIALILLLIGLLFISDSVTDISRQIAAQKAPAPVNTYSPEPGGHKHYRCKTDNMLPHEAESYGNIRSTIEYTPQEGGGWTKAITGEQSAELTDLLRWLNYQGQACKCPVEYTVDTEYGQGYGINYTEGFVRFGDSQTSLTEEQRKEVGKLMRWVYKHGEDISG